MAGCAGLYAAELHACPETVFRWKPAPDQWSVAEVMAHLADAEEIYERERLRPIQERDQPRFRGFDQDAYAVERRYNEQDPWRNLARFAAANARNLALAWSLPPEAWERTGVHEEAGVMTYRQVLLALFKHHASHLNQLRRIRAQYLERKGW
ncbi:MAG: DinB family protein [Clostridia bacterium]|nr:DinB family protein [Clostridia bacterium]